MIIAVSDWHLGFHDDWSPGMVEQPFYRRLLGIKAPKCDQSDSDMNKQDAILRFLDLCESSPVTDLVLLGDILDLWRRTNCEIFSLPEKYYHDKEKSKGLKNYLEAVSIGNPQLDPTIEKIFKNQRILRKLATMPMKVHYIIGNHDYYLLKLQERNKNLLPFEIKRTLRLPVEGKEYFFTHGYEMDILANYELFWDVGTYEQIAERLCYSDNKIGSVLSFLYGVLEKLNIRTLRTEVVKMRRTPSKRRQKLINDATTFTDLFAQSRAAFLMLGMNPSDVLIYGHTHHPYIDDNHTVVNTGSWCDDCSGSLQYPYVKIEGDNICLKPFTKDTKKL